MNLSWLLNNDFVKSIIKYGLLPLAAIGLVKSIRKDAADDKENEIKADQAEELVEDVLDFKEIEEEVHAEVNSHKTESETDNQLRASGWMREDGD